MYLLLIGIHIVFFYISYLMQNILMQWAFVILLLFFLLYFSPLFFPNRSKEAKNDVSVIPDLGISPQKSILIPLVLTYVGIYILAFTVTRDIGTNFNVHLYILLLIFIIFWGYIFAFDWDTVFFRDALRFHLICSYITIFSELVYFFFSGVDITSVHLLFSAVTLGFSYIFFTHFRDEGVHIFLACVTSTIISLGIIILYVFWDIHPLTLIWCMGICIIALFEYAPRIYIFHQFIEPTRLLLLSILLLFSWILLFSPLFSYFYFVYFLPLFVVFLFSIHIRYCNYIGYSFAVFALFFLYSFLFSSLLFISDIFSSLLFIFFFSICIIGNTYFWEERYPYDFAILHYSSIGFSAITVVYSLFFVAWWASMSLFLACSLFLLAILFLLSYFRFQYR